MSNFHKIRTSNYPIVVFVILLCSLMLNNNPLAARDGPSSAYEILKSYDLPAGLLPKGSTGYDLDEKTGKFSAYFNESCSFSLEGGYKLKYNSKINGYISKGRLSKLSGVSVKVLFLWFNIAEVTRNGDDLEFSVGIASADFSIDNFYIIPQCGCGLNCDGETKKSIRSPFVSSI